MSEVNKKQIAAFLIDPNWHVLSQLFENLVEKFQFLLSSQLHIPET